MWKKAHNTLTHQNIQHKENIFEWSADGLFRFLKEHKSFFCFFENFMFGKEIHRRDAVSSQALSNTPIAQMQTEERWKIHEIGNSIK